MRFFPRKGLSPEMKAAFHPLQCLLPLGQGPGLFRNGTHYQAGDPFRQGLILLHSRMFRLADYGFIQP
jgi:hypothetical protein